MNTRWSPWKQFGPLTIPHAIGIKAREEMQRHRLLFSLKVKHGEPLPGEPGQSGFCRMRDGGRAWYCVTAGNPAMLAVRDMQSGDVWQNWIGVMEDCVVAGGFFHDRG